MSKKQRQEWFDRAVRGLAKQDWEPARNSGGCQYLDPATGRRCAVGLLLTEREAAALPAGGVEDVRGNLPPRIQLALQQEGNEPFLRQLQSAHDRSHNPSEMKARLHEVAETWNLKLPKELREDSES